MKEFPCDLCGSSDAIEVPHSREYTNDQPIHICKGCGFIYVRMRRSAKEIADAWSEEIYGRGYTALIPAVVARQQYVAAFIEENLGLKEKTVCDIGAGEGQFLNIIKQPNYAAKPFGIEPSQENCRFLDDQKIANFPGTIEDYLASGKGGAPGFDIVTVMWTLENCMSCVEMLEGAHKLLKPGGHIVIATGSRILVPFKKPLHMYFSTVPADTNNFRFSARTMKGMLAKTGFQVSHMNRYIDTDWLVVVAEKKETGTKIDWVGDDWRDVVNFFERWHAETRDYFPMVDKKREAMTSSASAKTGRSWEIR